MSTIFSLECNIYIWQWIWAPGSLQHLVLWNWLENGIFLWEIVQEIFKIEALWNFVPRWICINLDPCVWTFLERLPLPGVDFNYSYIHGYEGCILWGWYTMQARHCVSIDIRQMANIKPINVCTKTVVTLLQYECRSEIWMKTDMKKVNITNAQAMKTKVHCHTSFHKTASWLPSNEPENLTIFIRNNHIQIYDKTATTHIRVFDFVSKLVPNIYIV